MNDWIYKKLNEKYIINYSLDQCIQLLGSDNIFLHDHEILCFGYKNNIKQFYYLKILASSPNSKTLQGPHEINVFDNDETLLQFWVWSLTTLRKKFFQFSDHLSFERSSYLILRGPQVLLRLKCVRSLLNILRKQPQQIQKSFSYEKLKYHHITPTSDQICVHIQRKNTKKVSIRVKAQQKKLMEQSFTSYLREFENTSLTKKEIFETFKKDILYNLQQLSDPTINAKETSEIMESIPENTPIDFELHEIDFSY
jgi:hypothetical protein